MRHVTIAGLLSLICLSALTNVGCGDNPPSTAPGAGRAADAQTPSGRPGKQPVETEIKNIVAKVLGVEPNAVDVNAPLAKQTVAADELDVVEIVMSIEETFGVEIKDEELTNERGEVGEDLSVKKLAEIVSRKKDRK